MLVLVWKQKRNWIFWLIMLALYLLFKKNLNQIKDYINSVFDPELT